MNITTYSAGVEVKATIPLIVDGVQIIAETVFYRIIDGKDNELVSRSAVTYVEGNETVSLIVSGLINAIAAGAETRDVRIIELYVNDGTGELKIEYIYGIEKESVLVEGVNSFQGYGRALMTAMSISKLDAWEEASKTERLSALIEARRSFSTLSLRHKATDNSFACVDSEFAVRDITALTQSQYLKLPEDLKAALNRAQVLQANHLLTSDENDDLRDSSVLSKTVGEAKIMFKAGIKHKGVVNSRAMQELTRWIISGKRIGRA